MTMNNYINVLKNFSNFSGRTSRKEYWMFFLFNILALVVLTIVEIFVLQTKLLTAFYNLLIIIPSVALCVRRMHDINRSGWWVIVPVVNFVFTFIKGDAGANTYGEPTT